MKRLSKAKRRRRMKVLCVSVLATVISVLVVGGILAVKSEFLKVRNSDVSKINLSSIKVPRPKINVRLLTENINSRPGIALRRVRGIVIHYTANPGTDAMANRNYFESRKNEEDSSKNKVSSHFIIITSLMRFGSSGYKDRFQYVGFSLSIVTIQNISMLMKIKSGRIIISEISHLY